MQVWSKMDFGTGEIIFLDITQKEDMLQVEYPNCFLLDMGWYLFQCLHCGKHLVWMDFD